MLSLPAVWSQFQPVSHSCPHSTNNCADLADSTDKKNLGEQRRSVLSGGFTRRRGQERARRCHADWRLLLRADIWAQKSSSGLSRSIARRLALIQVEISLSNSKLCRPTCAPQPGMERSDECRISDRRNLEKRSRNLRLRDGLALTRRRAPRWGVKNGCEITSPGKNELSCSH